MEDSTAAWLTALLCVAFAAAATFVWEFLSRPPDQHETPPSSHPQPRSSATQSTSAVTGEQRRESPRQSSGHPSTSLRRRYRQEGEPGFNLAVLGLVPCKLANGELKELGRGARGRVIQAKLEGGKDVAVKIVHLTAEQADRGLPRKVVEMQAQLKHPSLVHCHSAYLQGKTLIVVSELMKGGTLRRAITQDKLGSLHWYGHGRQIAIDVAKGLAHINSLEIMHAHLKSSSNVLLTKSGKAKLGNVSIARLMDASMSSSGGRGGVAWAAPELLLGERCTTAVALFSFGVLLWEVVTQEVPLRGKLRPPHVPSECPQEVANIIAECLQTNPTERPTADEVVQRLEAVPQLPAPVEARRYQQSVATSLVATDTQELQSQGRRSLAQVFVTDSSRVEVCLPDDKLMTRTGTGGAAFSGSVDTDNNRRRGNALSTSLSQAAPAARDAAAISRGSSVFLAAPPCSAAQQQQSPAQPLTACLDRMQSSSEPFGSAAEAIVSEGEKKESMQLGGVAVPLEGVAVSLEHQSNLQSNPGSVDYGCWVPEDGEGPPPNPFAAAASRAHASALRTEQALEQQKEHS